MAAAKKRRRRKKKKGGHYHTGTHTSPKAGDCIFRSGWEQLFMKCLDIDETVATYQYEPVCITYTSNKTSKRLRKYYPDFIVEHVDGRKRMIEIKPAKRVGQARVQKKLEAAQAWCDEHGMTLEVITEVELRQLGAFKKVLLGSS